MKVYQPSRKTGAHLCLLPLGVTAAFDRHLHDWIWFLQKVVITHEDNGHCPQEVWRFHQKLNKVLPEKWQWCFAVNSLCECCSGQQVHTRPSELPRLSEGCNSPHDLWLLVHTCTSSSGPGPGQFTIYYIWSPSDGMAWVGRWAPVLWRGLIAVLGVPCLFLSPPVTRDIHLARHSIPRANQKRGSG